MEDAEQMLRKLFDKIAKEQHYENYKLKLKSVSSGGANYTSVLYVATISSPDKEDLQLFAKVAAISEKTREIVPSFIYYIERYIYTDLVKKFQLMEDNCKVPQEDRFVVSKLYGFNTDLLEETLVLENLMAKGYSTYDRMKSIDWPYASKAVEVLAKFHALSIAYGEEYPEECQNLYEEMDGKLDFAYKSMDGLFQKSLNVALDATTEENRERLTKFFEDEARREVLHFTNIKRRTVLIHGDYRPSNLMHKINEDGTIEIIPVDFQTVRPGCMATDLIYLIFTGSDEAFRAKFYEKLLDHYYNKLCHSLRALRLDPDKLYSREDFEFEYKETLPFGLVISILLMPVITVEVEDAIKVQDDNLLENLMGNKTSSLYPKRMNGVINDYVKYGVI